MHGTKCASKGIPLIESEVVGRKESLKRPIFYSFTSSRPCIKVRKMPVSCCVYGCTNRARKEKSVRFFRFPEDEARQRCWESALRHKD